MGWTDLAAAFGYGTKLTSQQMQQLRDNIEAGLLGDTGSPDREAAGSTNYFSTGILGGAALGPTNSASYISVLSVTFPAPGEYRFYTQYFLDNGAGTAYFLILKNGATYLSWNTGSNGWHNRTDDITVVTGDRLVWQMRVNNGSYQADLAVNIRGANLTGNFLFG